MVVKMIGYNKSLNLTKIAENAYFGGFLRYKSLFCVKKRLFFEL